MIAGNSSRDFARDFIYNASPEALKKIQNGLAKIDHEAKSHKSPEEARKLSTLSALMSGDGLVNLYNAMKNGSLNDGFTTGSRGENVPREIVEAEKDIDALARIMSDKDMDIFEKMGDALELYTSTMGLATREEEERQGKSIAKTRETCEEENIRYGAPIMPEEKVRPEFKELYEWLKKFETTTSKKKVFKQMEKMSDIQKVSAVEFAKPRILFMKKLLNKDLWFRGEQPADRFLHCITDFSGSMGGYMGQRNKAWQMLFDTCKKAGITIENTMFNCGLEGNKAERIGNQETLNKMFRYEPDGGDDLGRSTVEKLKLLTRKKEKQYLIAISDGTGSFRNEEISEEAKRLAREKNVELKFILFSHQNSMQTISKDDIFYIYDGNNGKTKMKKGSEILKAISS